MDDHREICPLQLSCVLAIQSSKVLWGCADLEYIYIEYVYTNTIFVFQMTQFFWHIKQQTHVTRIPVHGLWTAYLLCVRLRRLNYYSTFTLWYIHCTSSFVLTSCVELRFLLLHTVTSLALFLPLMSWDNASARQWDLCRRDTPLNSKQCVTTCSICLSRACAKVTQQDMSCIQCQCMLQTKIGTIQAPAHCQAVSCSSNLMSGV